MNIIIVCKVINEGWIYTTNHDLNFMFQLNVFNLPIKSFISLHTYITDYNIFCRNIDNII